MSDLRSESRDQCEIKATITAGALTLPCLVEDLSDTGAKLAFDTDVELPAFFDLELPIFEGIGETKRAERRWQVGRRFGIRFVPANHG